MTAPGAGPALFTQLQCISQETQKVIASIGFTRTTPVQEAVIPLFCGNKDVAVDACTGSGKTLAFVIPVIEKLRKLDEALKKHQVGAIIVSPTRELARQIHNVAQPFVESVPGLSMLLLVGGSDPGKDVSDFKQNGGNIIVGTPGRIDDIMKRCPTMDYKRLEVFVLDEADRLLDMGFRVQLDAIMARLPKQRRTGLFSATQTEAVQALARAGLRNPVRVNVAVTTTKPSKAAKGATSTEGGTAGGDAAQATGSSQQKTPTGLHISYTVCEADEKLGQLTAFLQQHAKDCKIIVYCLTCACVDYYNVALKRLAAHTLLKGVKVTALHGKMKQSAREAMLESFTKLPAGVLLATDLAARGLDIPEVHWVVQMDPPQDPDAFVHRVGRTARAGRTGAALLYLTPNEVTYADFLKLRKVPMGAAGALPGAPDVTSLLRKEAEADREVMESGMKAFVSYIRGYKEHHCKFIFRVQDLAIGRLATLFSLLRLPHMQEVKRALTRTESGAKTAGLTTCAGFTPSQVDPETIPFKDKAREKQRQQMLKQKAAKEAQEAAQKNKRKAEQQQPHGNQTTSEVGLRLTAAKRRKLQQRDEVDELNAEYKLLKKLKKGKISEHDYDVATGLSSDSESDDEDLKGKAKSRKDKKAADKAGNGDQADVDAHENGQGSMDRDSEEGEEDTGRHEQGKKVGHSTAQKKGQNKPSSNLLLSGGSRLQQKLDAKRRKKKRQQQKTHQK